MLYKHQPHMLFCDSSETMLLYYIVITFFIIIIINSYKTFEKMYSINVLYKTKILLVHII